LGEGPVEEGHQGKGNMWALELTEVPGRPERRGRGRDDSKRSVILAS